jgi:MFS family permease
MPNTEPAPATDATVPDIRAPRSARSAMLIVFFVVVIDLLGFGIVLPMLPRIAESYVGPILGLPAGEPGAIPVAPPAEGAVNQAVPAERKEAVSGLIIGLLMASFSLMQFIFAPIWGRVSDRVGRRPILLLGLTGSVVFYTLFGYACTLDHATAAALALTLFFISRAGAGVAGATISTAQAVIADCTPPERRKHGMAMIGAAFGIGFTFGPLIGFAALYFYPDHFELIGYSAACLSLLALVLGVALLPETRRFGEASLARRHWIDLSALRFALASRAIAPVVLVFFLATLGFGGFEVTLSLLLKDSFGFSVDDSFMVFAFIGLVLTLTQGVLYRRLAARLSEVAFMTLGIVFMAIGVATLGFVSYHAITHAGAGSQALLYAALTAAVVGFAFLTPSAQALISRRTPDDRQGEILGVNQSASAMARILGPVLGVWLYKSTPTHLLPYALGAALLVVMLPLLPVIRRGGTVGEIPVEPARR